MSIARLRVLAIAVALAGSGVLISLLHAQTPPEWKVGDVFVAIGGGKYEVWPNSGGTTPKQTIQIANTDETAGCWFDSQFNLYTADFDNTRVIRHQLAVPHNQDVFANTNAEANNGHSQSIVMAVNGDVFVGNAGGGTQVKSILRYRSDGVFLQKYLPATDGGGINWMDLATDQRTMFYTSLGRKIKRFNVAGTGSPLSDFATLPGSGNSNVAHAIRLLPPFDANASGGLLVADKAVIRKVNGSGASTYDAAGEDDWQSLNLDPDGITFWAGGFTTGKLYRFNIASGAQVGSAIQTAGANALMGICVMGEAQLQIQPLQLSTGSGSTPVLKDVTASFGDPASFNNNTAFYSFSTWRLRIRVQPSRTIVAAVSFTPEITDFSCPAANDETNDFDCRFEDAGGPPLTQCVPFFHDPTAANRTDLLGTEPIGRYRCGYYRVKDMPDCTATSNGNCVDPFAEALVPGKNDILSEILMNLTNPPTSRFPVSFYGPEPKGNPRLMRDPDSEPGKQFFIDATTAVIDWPAFGTGTPNDYAPVQRKTEPGQGTGQGCVDIIGPNGNHVNGGSVLKIVIEVKDGVRGSNGLCTGNPLPGALNLVNNITLAISNQAQDFLEIFCATPGNSLGCFTPVQGQTARFQSTFDTPNPPFVPDTTNPYIFAVTSVNAPSADPNAQGAGLFPPVCKKIWICPSGNNCIPQGANLTCQ